MNGLGEDRSIDYHYMHTSMSYLVLAESLNHQAGMQGRMQLSREQQKAELLRLLAFWQTRQGPHQVPKQPEHQH